MSDQTQPATPGGEFILFQTEDGRTRLEVRFQGDTVWLSLKQMAELFQRDKSVISRHIKNVFEEGELAQEGTVAKSATVQMEGSKRVSREIEFYNLDVIISVGYRVKSHRGTQFRITATGSKNWTTSCAWRAASCWITPEKYPPKMPAPKPRQSTTAITPSWMPSRARWMPTLNRRPSN